VVFDENMQWDWTGGAEGSCAEEGVGDFIIEHRVVHQGGATTLDMEDDINMGAATPAAGEAVLRDNYNEPSPNTPTASPRTLVAAPVVLAENLDVDHDDAPINLRNINDLVGDETPPGYTQRVLWCNEQLFTISAEEPTSVAQAAREAVWRKAMIQELGAI
jgi:hypothetical protein